MLRKIIFSKWHFFPSFNDLLQGKMTMWMKKNNSLVFIFWLILLKDIIWLRWKSAIGTNWCRLCIWYPYLDLFIFDPWICLTNTKLQKIGKVNIDNRSLIENWNCQMIPLIFLTALVRKFNFTSVSPTPQKSCYNPTIFTISNTHCCFEINSYRSHSKLFKKSFTCH